MAGATVTVGERGRRGFFVLGPGIGGGTVLVFVVPEMFRRVATLVAAICRRRGPGKLDRQHHKQEDEEDSTHGVECSCAAGEDRRLDADVARASRSCRQRADRSTRMRSWCFSGGWRGEALNTISPFDIIPT